MHRKDCGRHMVIVVCCWALTMTACGNNQLREAPGEPDSIARSYIDERIRDNDAPALQYVVTDADGIVFEYASGSMDIAGRNPIATESTMMLYSMTKTFTAAAVMQLVEQGKVTLDDPIKRYIPEVPYPEQLTVRHLLNQTSGIPNPIPLRWVHLVEEHPGYDEQKTLDSILAEYPELNDTPGEDYGYSNISYWLLGRLIASVAGMTYQDYMRRHIIAPLGLGPNELDFVVYNSGIHAKGYLRKWSFINLFKSFVIDSKFFGEYEDGWLHIREHYLNGPAFGGLVGSARAASVFLRDMIQPDPQLMSPETRALFFEQAYNNSGEPIEMTPGWHIGETNGVLYYFKEGGGGGFHSEMRVYPDYGIGTVVIANSTSFDAGGLLDEVDVHLLPHRKPNRR